MANFMAIQPVAGANPDRIEPIEDIELRKDDAVDPGDLHALTHQRRVKPAAAPRAAGYRTVFASRFANAFADPVWAVA
jgi:hypothetical protein